MTTPDPIALAAHALERCRTVLGNMALENAGAIFNRWPINHEPLRSDARNLLPVVDEAVRALAASGEDDSKYDNAMFNVGVQHVVDLLAKTIEAEGWVAGDGSEDYDDDLAQTLLNILAARGLYDKEEAKFAALAASVEAKPVASSRLAEGCCSSIRPAGNNADEWVLWFYEHAGYGEAFLGVQIAEAIDEHQARSALLDRAQAPRIIKLQGDHGVCVGGRFDGWLMWRHPDGQWVTIQRLEQDTAPFRRGTP